VTAATRRRARPPLPALLAALALAAAACSGGSGGSDDADDAEAAEAAAGEPAGAEGTAGAGGTGAAEDGPPAEVEGFTGPVEAFYEVPDPLPAGEPGDLIRTMPIEAPPGEVGVRVMYHSTDAEGDARAVTGTVYHPAGEPPDGGWPVLAWAHGTTGLAPACAPSRAPAPPPAYGVRGVRVATDYIGLGPDGELHPYLSAAAEGHAVVDGVAAARALREAGAGDRWVAVGHSQGGHAALVTNEMAAERLPDAELVGSVAIAPGAQLAETYGDDLQVRIITTLVLFGAAREDPAIDPATYLSPEAHAAAAGLVEEACLGEVVNALVPFAGSPAFFATDPRADPVGRAWLEDNDPGRVVSESPLMIVQGGRDAVVVPARTDALMARLCELGQVVHRLDLPDANHDTEPVDAEAQITDWVAARFAGDPPPDDC
jgi:pimeloyl-ACP methyl ester carboxylesterase